MSRVRCSVASLAMVGLAGCSMGSDAPRAPAPAKPIDAASFYTGRWFEIGRTPMKLTDGCVAGTTDYLRNRSGQLIERDACHMTTPQGEEESYEGPVTILDPGSNTKISVRYTVWGVLPVWREYWMLDRADDYQWFIVSDPEFETVSVFTRSARPGQATEAALAERVRQLGYDPRRLEFPEQFPAAPAKP